MTETEHFGNQEAQPGKFDINAVIADAKLVITAPASYFKSMPKTGGLSEPLIFIAVMSVIAGVLYAVLSFSVHRLACWLSAWPRLSLSP